MTTNDTDRPSLEGPARHQATLSILGVPMVVSANAAELVPFVERICAPGVLEAADDAPPGVELRVDLVPELPEPPESARFRFEHFGTLCFADGTSLWLKDASVAGRLVGDERIASVCFSAATPPEPMAVQRVVIVAVIELLRRAGRYQLHASCIARDDACLLIAGDQRSGKTTAALAMVSAGWSCLTDDLVFLCRGLPPARIAAFGWQEHLNVGEPTLDAFGLRGHARGRRSDGRFSVSPANALPALDRGARVPRAIILSEIVDADASTVEPVARAHTLARLVRHSPLVLVTGVGAEEHLAVLRDLVSQCACFRLRGGRDILEGALPGLVASMGGGLG
jgi:hypothetical protein